VCVDVFTKWVEVAPLRRHDALSVAVTFTKMCLRWGPPDEVRVDNGTEFSNAIVDALMKQFNVTVKTGAVRHPQSQGGVERVNRTLLTLMRKVLDEASDWRAELDLLLHYYHGRPHSTTGVSPMMAMNGWQSRDLIMETNQQACRMSEWVTRLGERAARVRDVVESALSADDGIREIQQPIYHVNQPVLFKRPNRSRKVLPPYEVGWRVAKIISASTVVIKRDDQEKVVNVELLKPSPVDVPTTDDESDENMQPVNGQAMNGDGHGVRVVVEPAATLDPAPPRYGLRNRDAIVAPDRYQQ